MPKPLQRESDHTIDSSPPSSGLDRSLGKSQRLVRSRLFSETFSQNRKWVGRYMILWLRSGEDADLRLGVVTSKKVHLRANKRNRARRRIREAYRNIRPYLNGDFDVLIVGRRAILNADWHAILKEMLWLANKAGLISEQAIKQAQQEFKMDEG